MRFITIAANTKPAVGTNVLMMKLDFENMTPGRALALFAALVTVLAIYVYRDFLMFDKLFLFKDIGSDTINAFYPRLIHLANYLRSDGLPRWSFNQGMGQSIFPVSLGNPFEWPLFVLGADRLAYGIAYMEVLKVILGGVLFYLYLRLLSESVYVCVIGGLLYAFSGFMILGGTWYNFSAQAVMFALLLYAFEAYLQRGTWWLLPLGIALIAASFSFNLYTHAVFFLLYGAMRYIDQYGWRPRAMAVFSLKVVGLALLGAGIGAVFLFANVQEILQSQRVSGEGSLVKLLKAEPVFSFASEGDNVAALMRAFSSNMTGVGSSYHGMNNYLEDPMLYCGLIALLLAPQFFVFLERRRRILYGVMAFIFILPVVLPYFRFAFWLFSGDYYRILSMFIALVAVLFALKALGRILATNRLDVWLLVATLAVLLAALLYPYELSGQYEAMTINPPLKWITAGFLCLYAVLIVGLARHETRFTAAVMLLVTVCGELVMTASMTVNDRPVITAQEFHARVGYNDYSADAVDYLKKNDKGFYRIEKTYHSGVAIHTSLNDAMVQNYWGTSSYYSFNESSYLDFLDGVGMFNWKDDREGRRWIPGLIGRPFLLPFASVKYVLINNSDMLNRAVNFGFRKIGQLGDVFIVRNPSALPLGFTYDTYMPRAEFMRIADAKKKDIALLKAVVLDTPQETAVKGRYQRLNASGLVDYGMKDYVADTTERARQSLVMDHFSQNEIAGTITLDKDRLLFFSIPYDKGWHAEVDGEPAELLRVNIGFMGLTLTSGEHTVTLRYQQPYFWLGLSVSLLALAIYAGALIKARRKRSPQRPIIA